MPTEALPLPCPICGGPGLLEDGAGVCVRCSWGWEQFLATEQTVAGTREWRCRGCGKLFALHGYAAGLFLRCGRCKRLNIVGNRPPRIAGGDGDGAALDE